MNSLDQIARLLFDLSPTETVSDTMREITHYMFDGNKSEQIWAIRTFQRMMGHP